MAKFSLEDHDAEEAALAFLLVGGAALAAVLIFHYWTYRRDRSKPAQAAGSVDPRQGPIG